MTVKDTLFQSEWEGPDPKFRFDEKVAEVFDDMVARSVPHYRYQQEIAAKLALHFHRPGGAIYDLGCATGNTLREICRTGLGEARIVGVDVSGAMLDRARSKGLEGVELLQSRIEEVEIQNASVVLMLYTLQFLPLPGRPSILKKIHAGLRPGGCLILCEKVKAESDLMESPLERIYEDFKRENDYSEEEIRKKKKALKDVLEPVTVSANLKFLSDASFRHVEIFFKALQFCGFLAVKEFS